MDNSLSVVSPTKVADDRSVSLSSFPAMFLSAENSFLGDFRHTVVEIPLLIKPGLPLPACHLVLCISTGNL